MIIKALYDYYIRKSQLGEIAPLGFEEKQIPFLVLIDSEGNFKGLQDTRDCKKDKGKKFILPKAKGRSGKNAFKNPNLLWDSMDYVLSYAKSSSEKDIQDANKKAQTFLNLVKNLADAYPENSSFIAVVKFLENPKRLEEVSNDEKWADCVNLTSCNLTFKLIGEKETVCADKDVFEFVAKSISESIDTEKSRCLITGDIGEIAQTHAGVSLPGQSGVKLVSFQKNKGYDSYCKEQGANAPISKSAEIAYTTSLASMLASDSRNKAFIEGLTILFWGDENNEFESYFSAFINPPKKDNPDASVGEMKNLLKSVFSGRNTEVSSTRFYILGLESNTTRIVVRFWYCAPLCEISQNIKMHFEDFDIVKSDKDYELFGIFNILTQLKLESKADKSIEKLRGEIIKSAISGSPYPQTLQLRCINRIRADRKINRIRAAILKAFLNRKNRISKNESEIKMALDNENKNIGYLSGRLFAVLEKIQQKAAGGKLNATIVDRYYGSASTTPVAVFGRLMDLTNHHLSKITDQGIVIFYKKLLGEIFDKMPAGGFPAHLSLDDQSRFAIGYYQQTQDFFKKSNKIEK